MEKVNGLVSRRAVVVFSKSSCCLCHSVKTLLSELGVDADAHELDQEQEGREMQIALSKVAGRSTLPMPMVFIGGRMIGFTDRVMSLHLRGQLVQLLRDAGALLL